MTEAQGAWWWVKKQACVVRESDMSDDRQYGRNSDVKGEMGTRGSINYLHLHRLWGDKAGGGRRKN